MQIQVSTVKCPKCGNPEMHPDGDKLLIRGFKVHSHGYWWSQCLVCSGYYDKDLNVLVNTPEEIAAYEAKPSKGWF